MKLREPLVYRRSSNLFLDDRGYLNALNIRNLKQKLPNKTFNFAYQLVSISDKKDTFRGFHYQSQPYEQNKLIVILNGEVLDLVVPVDVPNIFSIKTYNLVAGDAILIPSNYAHGFITLTDNVLMQYFLDETYSEDHYEGINGRNYLNHHYPEKKFFISEKDRHLENHLIDQAY